MSLHFKPAHIQSLILILILNNCLQVSCQKLGCVEVSSVNACHWQPHIVMKNHLNVLLNSFLKSGMGELIRKNAVVTLQLASGKASFTRAWAVCTFAYGWWIHVSKHLHFCYQETSVVLVRLMPASAFLMLPVRVNLRIQPVKCFWNFLAFCLLRNQKEKFYAWYTGHSILW